MLGTNFPTERDLQVLCFLCGAQFESSCLTTRRSVSQIKSDLFLHEDEGQTG